MKIAGARGVGAALAAALLFGASTPAAKPLAGALSAPVLAGLLYLGSGIGLALVIAARGRTLSRLARGEWPWLAGAIAAGGVLGPLLLVAGLARLPASAASLLLNAEAALTALFAWFLFREAWSGRIALGMALIVGGAVALAAGPGGDGTLRAPLGPSLLILGACACWALDNNLTRRVSHADAVELAALKGLVAGGTNLGLGLALGGALPPATALGRAGVIGFLGYGVSLALFIVALRELGASRASAYFSIAPFAGAALSVAVLGEPASPRLLLAGALMAAGVFLHLSEAHDHEHDHEALEHAHEHEHDEHHPHGHDPPPPGRHAHWHRHEPMRHSHPHAPDIHHRHRH